MAWYNENSSSNGGVKGDCGNCGNAGKLGLLEECVVDMAEGTGGVCHHKQFFMYVYTCKSCDMTQNIQERY